MRVGIEMVKRKQSCAISLAQYTYNMIFNNGQMFKILNQQELAYLFDKRLINKMYPTERFMNVCHVV